MFHIALWREYGLIVSPAKILSVVNQFWEWTQISFPSKKLSISFSAAFCDELDQHCYARPTIEILDLILQLPKHFCLPFSSSSYSCNWKVPPSNFPIKERTINVEGLRSPLWQEHELKRGHKVSTITDVIDTLPRPSMASQFVTDFLSSVARAHCRS